jgi:chromosome partitioning protein
MRVFTGQVLGVLPFRDKLCIRISGLAGLRRMIAAMQQVAGAVPVLPSIMESERYKQAIRQGQRLSEMGHADLEFPLYRVIEVLEQEGDNG